MKSTSFLALSLSVLLLQACGGGSDSPPAPAARSGGFIISAISGNTSESGTSATFTVRLSSQPTAAVTIPVSSSDTSEASVASASLTFTDSSWNTNQTVTVTGVGDLLADGNVAYSITLGPASSADTLYAGLDPSDVTASNLDDTVSVYGVTPAISAGNYHSLLLANDGTVWGWGSCGNGQLDITPTCTSTATLPQQLNISAKAAAISAGYNFSAIVDNNGMVWSSGVNTSGQLGHTKPPTTLTKVNNLSEVKVVAAGTYHALALKNDGTVWAWGDGGAGQLGNGLYLSSLDPVQAIGGLAGKTVTAIAIGSDHSLAMDNTGSVYSWGSDGYEQLGGGIAGVDNYSATPTALSSLSGVSVIGAGQLQSFANGVSATISDVYGWGSNDDFQLGTSSGTPKSLPTAVNVFNPTLLPSRLDGGPFHTVALLGNAIYTWGDNDADEAGIETNDNRGALGVGNIIDNDAPTVAFTAGGSALDVNAGANYTLVLFSDGRLQTSGKNSAAQLGSNEIDIGVATYTSTPVFVEDPSDAGKGSPSTFYAYRPILAGYPAAATSSTTATVWVCPANLVAPANCGPISHYKYSTDSGTTWGTAIPIATPISLVGLPPGPVNLWVKGMSDASTVLQSDASAVKVAWLVN